MQPPKSSPAECLSAMIAIDAIYHAEKGADALRAVEEDMAPPAPATI